MKCLRFSGRFLLHHRGKPCFKPLLFYSSLHTTSKKRWCEHFNLGNVHESREKYLWVIKVKRVITVIVSALKEIEAQSSWSTTKSMSTIIHRIINHFISRWADEKMGKPWKFMKEINVYTLTFFIPFEFKSFTSASETLWWLLCRREQKR